MATKKIRKSRKRKTRRGGMFKSSPNKIPIDENNNFILLTLPIRELTNQKTGEGKNITVWVVRGNQYIEGYLTYYEGNYYLFRDDEHNTGYLLIDQSDLIYKCKVCIGSFVNVHHHKMRENFIRQIRHRNKSFVKDTYFNGQFPNPIYIKRSNQTNLKPNPEKIENNEAVEYQTNLKPNPEKIENNEAAEYNNIILEEGKKISQGKNYIGEALRNKFRSKDVKVKEFASAYMNALQLRSTLEREYGKWFAKHTKEEIKKKIEEIKEKRKEIKVAKEREDIALKDYLSHKTPVHQLVHSQESADPANQYVNSHA